MKFPSNVRATQWAVAVLMTGLSAMAVAQEARRPYIVQLTDAPAASYAGGVSGLAATKAVGGARLDTSAAEVQAYLSFLDAQQSKVTASLPNIEHLYDYRVVFNGFSAMLTEAEASKLLGNSAVTAVTLDEMRQLNTNYTPAFVGLTGPGGLWAQLGGPTGTLGQAGAGEDIIIGIVDGGVWPENTSFADRVDANGVATFDAAGELVYGPPPASWKGECESGEAFGPANCNNKLIGARAFRKTISLPDGSLDPAFKKHAAEFLSPRDNGGHGTHTASTAGGNAKVTAIMDGGTVPVAGVSGIAPRARVATYKVCWTRDDPATTRPDPRWPNFANGCYGNDSMAAIEQAVKDGVHVLNYSISGSATNIADPVDVAFKGAVDAGVFVAASAGNSGPANEVNHLGPWMTTVGNSTHDRLFAGTVTLGNGVKYVGASSNPATPAGSQMILAKDAGLPGVLPTNINLQRCYGVADGAAALLDPAKVAGKLLVCDRGGNVLVNKSGNAKTAGAVGMIIGNVAGGANTIINQGHVLSTVHVNRADGDLIRAYVAAGSATGGLDNLAAIKDLSALAPAMNDSSSRGPNKGNFNILKPDLTAPGTQILAGYTPAYTIAAHDAMIAGTQAGVANWSLLTGTSMSSPHVAGFAALLRHKHPTWTPAAIRSAMMTTGMNVANTLSGMQAGLLPWGQGAGFVRPTNAADPGLVYDISPADYNKFLCGVGVTPPGGATCASIGSISSVNLNLPSLTAGSVFGNVVFQRTVTNVGGADSTYTSSISVPGFDALVTPAVLTLAAGESKSFTVKLSRTTAPQDVYSYGSLSWTDGSHVVRSPVTARAQLLVAPSTLSGKATTGNKSFTVGTGFAGAMGSSKAGLKAATRTGATVNGTNSGAAAVVASICAAGGGTGVKAHDFTVSAATPMARFSLFNVDTSGFQSGGLDDLDLVMVNSAGVQVGYSGNGGSDESISLAAPAAGNYKVCVVSYAPAAGTTANYTLSSWVLNSSDVGGNLRVLTPSRAVVGGTATASVSWSGLVPDTRYLGVINYQVGGATVASTVLNVDTKALPMPSTAELDVNKEAAAKAL